MPPPAAATAKYELKIERDVDVPREKIFRCWTEPALLDQWFCPKPFRTRHTAVEPRPGGRFDTEIYNSEGDECFPSQGVFLEVVPNERLVWTDAYAVGWVPRPDLSFTGMLTLQDLGQGRTRYTGCALHWSQEAMDKHAAMGFVDGWNKALDQLIELANTM